MLCSSLLHFSLYTKQGITTPPTSLMAVEAQHMNLFPSHLIPNREFLKPNQDTTSMYNTQMDCGLAFNHSTTPEMVLPLYQSLVCEPLSAKADSGLTYNVAAPPRKRDRDPTNDFDALTTVTQKPKFTPPFVDDDIMFQIQQQQSEISQFVLDHTQKVRIEIEERRKRQSRMLLAAIQEGLTKKLKEKDEEILRMGKLNFLLQERVKSLYVENQIWRDLAQTNEATANSLRTNLEQVLAHVSEDRHVSSGAGAGATLADDAESSCGSSDHGRCAEEEDEVELVKGVKGNRMCKKCGEKESSVLLLPCRHLCLCTLCGSTLLGTCPVCNSVMNASVHVNMS